MLTGYVCVPALLRQAQVIKQRLEEARGFAAGGGAMVEGQADRHASMYFDAGMHSSGV